MTSHILKRSRKVTNIRSKEVIRRAGLFLNTKKQDKDILFEANPIKLNKWWLLSGGTVQDPLPPGMVEPPVCVWPPLGP